jgi:Haemolymph juvenile hormone binding protein (JHBP)
VISTSVAKEFYIFTRFNLNFFAVLTNKPCKIESPFQDDCIKSFLENVFSSPEMNPYVISSYSAELPKNGVVDGTLDFKDIRVSGLRNSEFVRVAARIERPNFILGMHFTLPSLSFVFNSTSKLLKGVFRGNLTDGVIKVKVTGTIENDENEEDLEHIKINDSLVIVAFEEYEQDLSEIEDGLLSMFW